MSNKSKKYFYISRPSIASWAVWVALYISGCILIGAGIGIAWAVIASGVARMLS